MSKKKKKRKDVQIIKKKYIMTNIDTQETDYSVYGILCLRVDTFKLY
jgi:hypothetical protein